MKLCSSLLSIDRPVPKSVSFTQTESEGFVEKTSKLSGCKRR